MTAKINRQIEMEREFARIKASGTRPLLVLHSCCAPCSSAVLERLNAHFQILVYYYNPNIAPMEEFMRRSHEQQRLIHEMPLASDIGFVEGKYDADLFYERVRGHEGDREGGERCSICFEMRLRSAAEYAKRIGASYFTTTLTISPLKDAQRLNELGLSIAGELSIRFLEADFKKKDGYRRSIELSAEHGLYRQDYCGCVFSKLERERSKEENTRASE